MSKIDLGLYCTFGKKFQDLFERVLFYESWVWRDPSGTAGAVGIFTEVRDNYLSAQLSAGSASSKPDFRTTRINDQLRL